MSKKKTASGGENLKARGLIGLLVPVTPEVRRLVTAAAGLADRRNSAWCAAALEAAARQALKAAGVDPDKL